MNRELPLTKGDIVLVKRRINDDWFEGEHQGQTGIFPVSYVELRPIKTSEGEAIVKYDFFPQHSSELRLRKVRLSIDVETCQCQSFLCRAIVSLYYVKLTIIGMKDVSTILKEYFLQIILKSYANRKVREKLNIDRMNESIHLDSSSIQSPLKSVLKTSPGFQQTVIDKMNLLSQSSLPMQKYSSFSMISNGVFLKIICF